MQSDNTPRVYPHSHVIFHKLRYGIQEDDDGYYAIVRWDTDDSIKVTKDVLEMAQSLANGHSVKQAAIDSKLAIKDVLFYVHFFLKNGLIKTVDGVSIPDTAKKIHPWKTIIPDRWFCFFTTKFFLYPSFLFIISGLSISFLRPEYMPTYKNYFWTTDIFTVTISLYITSFLLIGLHELGHFIATKAVGGEAKMNLNNRFIFLVAETQSYHVATIPKVLRYIIYSAGMYFDFLIIAACFWIMVFLNLQGISHEVLHNFLLIIVLAEMRSIIWQYNVYIETDIYNIFSEYLDNQNLHNNAYKYILNKIIKLPWTPLLPVKKIIQRVHLGSHIQPADVVSEFSKKQKNRLLLYAIIMVISMFLLLLYYAVYQIPRDSIFIMNSIEILLHSLSNYNGIMMIKALAVLAFVSLDYVVLAIIVQRKFTRKTS